MRKLADTVMPTKWGNFRMKAYGDEGDRHPHLALISGTITPGKEHLVRIHSECMTGDVFGSLRCDCGEQLAYSMQQVSKKGGAVIYLRQEGRGIGLINKLHAYNLQDEGFNTADANTELGFEVDARDYSIAIEILNDLGIHRIKLLTNNPLKLGAFEDSSIKVINREPIIITPKSENIHYLLTKQKLMGHMLDLNGHSEKK